MRTSIFICIILLAFGCVPSDIADIELEDTTQKIAIPLVNTTINIMDVEQEVNNGSVSVSANEKGQVSVTYFGEVVNRNWDAIFPEVPIVPFQYKEPVSDIAFINPLTGKPLLKDEKITYIEFQEINIRHKLSHSNPSPITVTLEIPQLTKNGVTYTETFSLPDGSNTVEVITNPFSLSDYTFNAQDNVFQIKYDARDRNGESVMLNESIGFFQPFKPAYIEGYLGRGSFDVQGKVIVLDLFSNWKSGGAVFSAPRIDLFVENSLGLPISSDVKEFVFTTIDDESFDLESQYLTEGIDFNYPRKAERGQTKTTTFSFTNQNSNVGELFKEKIKRISYDIDAIFNKEEKVDLTQFVDRNGAFAAKVNVVIPLQGTINDLVLQDTVDIDLSEVDKVKNVELKTVAENEFPLDLLINASIIDESGNVLGSVFEENLLVKGAKIDENGKTLPAEKQVIYSKITDEKWAQLVRGDKIVYDIKLNTVGSSDNPVWIYQDYDISLKMGAIAEVNAN